MPTPPHLRNGRYLSEVVAESDRDQENQHPALEQQHSRDSDADNELLRNFKVVLSEVGQRMDEKWQLARSRSEGEEYEEYEQGLGSSWVLSLQWLFQIAK